ncbi:hypothetical protein B8W69_02900 [Mycobacterium vulneris]|uniref:Uncharacterized protein n=1 Tax=Mycolicibacterium vulneris TaxID=547163 RepID=A0A1X2LDL2_9MYCO|nr:hypothetical protein B8W69_02900 [Mycolicibacterium vulneris]
MIEQSSLDVQPVAIEGTVLTVSTVQNQQWLIEKSDGSTVPIKHSNLPHDQTFGIATGARLRILAEMKTSVSNAGVTKTTYEATHVEKINDES